MAKILSSKPQKQSGMWRTILSWYASQDKVVKTGVLAILLITISAPYIAGNVLNLKFEAQSQNIAMLIIAPNTQTFKRGDTVTYEVHENSCNTPIDEVRLNIAYATDKLSLQNVNFDASSFPNEDEYLAQNGLIQIGRSSTAPVTGDQYVLKAEFTAVQDADPNTPAITVNSGTSVTDTTGTNVITTKTIVAGQQGASEEVQNTPNCPSSGESAPQPTFIDTITHTLGQVVSPVLHLFK